MNKLKIYCPNCGCKALREIFSIPELSNSSFVFKFICNECDKSYRVKPKFVEEGA